MRNVLPQIDCWLTEGKQVAVATVVKVWGSAPRRPGSRMAVSSGGDVAGSVSGGCVEGAVFEVAQKVLESGQPQLAKFGVSDEDAFAVAERTGITRRRKVARPATIGKQTHRCLPGFWLSLGRRKCNFGTGKSNDAMVT